MIVPYLRVANVQAGFLDLSEIKTIEALPSEVDELSLKPGDVLLTEGGDHDKLGRGAMWQGQIEGCIHQNHVFRVRTHETCLLARFFLEFLQTPATRSWPPSLLRKHGKCLQLPRVCNGMAIGKSTTDGHG